VVGNSVIREGADLDDTEIKIKILKEYREAVDEFRRGGRTHYGNT